MEYDDAMSVCVNAMQCDEKETMQRVCERDGGARRSAEKTMRYRRASNGGKGKMCPG